MSSVTNINKSQRIAMNTVILFIRMFVLTIINLYTVRLVLKGLGVIDYGIFNAVAGVVTTSAFLISILELAIQRFYSISLGKNDQETLNQLLYQKHVIGKQDIFLRLIVRPKQAGLISPVMEQIQLQAIMAASTLNAYAITVISGNTKLSV